jgi:Protein of unknown function (DUF2694)
LCARYAVENREECGVWAGVKLPGGHYRKREQLARAHDILNTDVEGSAQGILLTADVSYLKAVLEIRGEIVAAGYTPSAEVPTAHDLDMAIAKLVAH